MLAKWVITLKALIVFTSHAGAHCPSRSMTGSNPARIKNSNSTTERIKLTTWLRVRAEVMALMAQGFSNGAIATRLGVTERGVERHVTGIFEKLGLAAAGGRHRRVLAVLRYVQGP